VGLFSSIGAKGSCKGTRTLRRVARPFLSVIPASGQRGSMLVSLSSYLLVFGRYPSEKIPDRFPIKNVGNDRVGDRNDGAGRNEILGIDLPVGRLPSLWFLSQDAGVGGLPGVDFFIAYDSQAREHRQEFVRF